ncbi:HD domain-containing protein [Candidatus Woesearchaeota archaeon]|nr:HD domain-containing protein [Candidatus Woesearchaeota archaeon]
MADNMDTDIRNAARLFFEWGELKRVKRSGWWLAKVRDPESVAEHSCRAALIAYVLAKLEGEGIDAHKASFLALANDLHETRLNDLHKVGQRYIDFKSAEKRAFADIVERFPTSAQQEMRTGFAAFQADGSEEGIIARDADLLECAVQAKEYIETGYTGCSDWIGNVRKLLKTESAKRILDAVEKTDSESWYRGLKRIER